MAGNGWVGGPQMRPPEPEKFLPPWPDDIASFLADGAGNFGQSITGILRKPLEFIDRAGNDTRRLTRF